MSCFLVYLTILHVNSCFVLFPFTWHWKFPIILLLLTILAFHDYQVFSQIGISSF